MARKTAFVQQVFSGGMVDSVGQDIPGEQPLQTVLHMDNYDPTIIDGYAVKRYGFALLRTEKDFEYDGETVRFDGHMLATTDGFNAPADTDLLMFDTDNWSNHHTTTQNATPINQGIVLGWTSIPYHLPETQDVVVAFVRNRPIQSNIYVESMHETTLVVAYAVDAGTTAQYWNNPFVNGQTLLETDGDPIDTRVADYPGWWAYGTLADFARHGGSMLYTTVLVPEYDDIYNGDYAQYQHMYPVYTWTWQDLRKKREGRNLFWNITPPTDPSIPYPAGGTSDPFVGLSSDTKYARFKTLYPSLFYNRNEMFSVRAAGFAPAGVDPSRWLTAVRNPYVNYDLTNSSHAMAAPIELMINEVPLRTFQPNADGLFDANGVYKKNVDTFRYPELDPSPHLNTESVWVESLETLRNEDVYAQRDDKFWQFTPFQGVAPTFDGFDSQWSRETRTMAIGGREVPVDLIFARGGGAAPTAGNSDQDGAFSDPNYNDEQYEDTKRRHVMVYGTRLPDYITSRTPRTWLKGEKIPMIVTAVVNGAEVIIGRFTYTVQGERMEYPYPNLFNMFTWLYRPYWYSKGFSAVGANDLWSVSSRNHLFNMTKYTQLTLDGLAVTPTTFMHAHNVGLFLIYSYDVGEALTWQAYCYEPYNPTIDEPFRPRLNTISGEAIYRNALGYTFGSVYNSHPGYFPKHNMGNAINMKLRIDRTRIRQLVDGNISRVNVYVAKSDPDKSLLRSIGLFAYQESVPPTLYGLPQTLRDDELSKYGLWKSYVFDGEAKPFADYTDYEAWKERYEGQPLEINAWIAFDNVIVSAAHESSSDATVRIPDARFPGDLLWDYAISGKTLTLNSSGEYWRGKGARIVSICKGMTFLGGCINEYGEDEAGIIRYSDVQNGVITYDVFSKERFLKLGSYPHTALMEFREQLWAFSAHELHRVQIVNPAQPEEWEILEKVPGQGTFAPKTVTTCPYGVVWANERGLWLSDGGEPVNLAESIVNVWQKVTQDRAYRFASLVDMGEFRTDKNDRSIDLEVFYEPDTDEIVVASTIFGLEETGTEFYAEKDFYLRYNIKRKVWHAEHQQFPLVTEDASSYAPCPTPHRLT